MAVCPVRIQPPRDMCVVWACQQGSERLHPAVAIMYRCVCWSRLSPLKVSKNTRCGECCSSSLYHLASDEDQSTVHPLIIVIPETLVLWECMWPLSFRCPRTSAGVARSAVMLHFSFTLHIIPIQFFLFPLSLCSLSRQPNFCQFWHPGKMHFCDKVRTVS